SHSESLNTGYGFSTSTNYKNRIIGIGLFNSYPISEKFSGYFGVRTGYAKRVREHENGSSSTYHTTENLSGYMVSPTLGIEYRITNNFNVCFEAEYSHYKYDGKGSTAYTSPERYTIEYDVEDSGQNTNTRFLIRYFY
ncbi:MAG: hypothetical protein P8166_13450, partial [Candidatus Thiodiazotropha sp.]